MTLTGRFPSRLLTARGWGFVVTAVVALLCAQVLGRRDLLYVGVLLLALPLASLLVLKVLRPRFTVARSFQPRSVETGSATTVSLSLAATAAGGASISMEEHVPARFGRAPRFTYPSRSPARDGVSRYEYRLRSAFRGVYDIGPVTAEFTDPFGLGISRHVLGGTNALIVTPAPVELLASALSGSRGSDGMAATSRQANPSGDDVMTREYRHGDSLRRVHWAATARYDELMVRQEESVTTPRATLLLDQRHSSFSAGSGAALGAGAAGPSTSPTFEWAVTAAMSISAHLLDRSYALRFLDHHGAPALLRSPSAPFPSQEEHQGQGAIAGIAEGLAALELAPGTGRHHRAGDHAGSTAVQRGGAACEAPRRSRRSASETGRHAQHTGYGDDLLDKLAASRHHGPLIAVLGVLTTDETRALASAADSGSASFALITSERPAESRRQLEILREAGWHAVAVSPAADLPSVWAGLDDALAGTPADTATAVFPPRNGIHGGPA